MTGIEVITGEKCHSWYSTALRLQGGEPLLWQSGSRLSLQRGQLLTLPTFIWDNGKAPSYCHFCSLLGIWKRDRKKSFVVYYSSATAGCLAFKAVPVSIHSFFGNYYKITKKRIKFFQYHNQFLIIDYNFRHRHWLALIDVVWMHSTQLCCVPGGQLGCGYLSRMLGI